MIRIFSALFLAAIVTFALLAFMSYLVEFGDTRVTKRKETQPIEINPVVEESDIRRKVRFKPKPPPPTTPPRPVAIQPEVIDQTDRFAFDMPAIEMESSSALVTKPSAMMIQEGDATPIIRIEPRYPMNAARDGTEGYVILSFAINTLGGVEDIKIIESEPGRVFDREARRALRNWKYKPKIVDGKPQKQINQTVQIDFSLEKKGK